MLATLLSMLLLLEELLLEELLLEELLLEVSSLRFFRLLSSSTSPHPHHWCRVCSGL